MIAKRRWDIRLLHGVGPIDFGMSRDTVAKTLGARPRSRLRNMLSAREHDIYDGEGVFVHYNEDWLCVALEFYSDADLVCETTHLFKSSASTILNWARSKDAGITETSDGFVATAIGMSMYAPALNDPGESEEPAEGFMVCSAGYIEEEERRVAKARELYMKTNP